MRAVANFSEKTAPTARDLRARPTTDTLALALVQDGWSLERGGDDGTTYVLRKGK